MSLFMHQVTVILIQASADDRRGLLLSPPAEVAQVLISTILFLVNATAVKNST